MGTTSIATFLWNSLKSTGLWFRSSQTFDGMQQLSRQTCPHIHSVLQYNLKLYKQNVQLEWVCVPSLRVSTMKMCCWMKNLTMVGKKLCYTHISRDLHTDWLLLGHGNCLHASLTQRCSEWHMLTRKGVVFTRLLLILLAIFVKRTCFLCFDLWHIILNFWFCNISFSYLLPCWGFRVEIPVNLASNFSDHQTLPSPLTRYKFCKYE